MSGFVGIVHRDGSPVDAQLLRRLTASMARRGPDGQTAWSGGGAGLGHALLRTGASSADGAQPASLDGRLWIAADARVDGRADLVRALASRGGVGPGVDLNQASDAELILHAYDAWGEHCVDRLLGDFAFAIWDARARRLFCARDRFGVKPFYYAEIPGALVFGNTLACMRLHPGVRTALNDRAIADFLLFGFNQDTGSTAFADVRRLPPSHRLTCGPGGAAARVSRYWTPPADGRIRYRRARDYVDHFRALLQTSVADRLGASRPGVWMSGGLDSTSIAAVARRVLARRGGPVDLRAQTIVYDTLIPDRERPYARLAAEALGIGVTWVEADGYAPLDERHGAGGWTPEPSDDPFLALRAGHLQDAARQSRVMLCGEGADEALRGSYVVDLLGRMSWRELGADVARALVFHRRRPGAGIRARLGARFGRGPARAPYPSWLNRDFERRLDLRARWEQITAGRVERIHPLRPEAHRRLTGAVWPWYFESWDPGVTGAPVEGRYPFLDVRLLEFLLAIPPIPWCVDKHILREAMCGMLPDEIRLRPKAPLAGDPLRAHASRGADGGLAVFEPAAALDPYVDRWRLKTAVRSGAADPSVGLRPLCLERWLEGLERGGQAGKQTRKQEADDDRQIERHRVRRGGQETVRAASAHHLR